MYPRLRWKTHDYSAAGLYFVTIVTGNRIPFFGRLVRSPEYGTNERLDPVSDAHVELSALGRCAEACWKEIPRHFPFVTIDQFIVMPDHVHGIIIIGEQENTGEKISKTYHPNVFGPQSKNLASIVRGFKVGVTKYARMHELSFSWQSRYHDRVIRDFAELSRIRDYIAMNPMRAVERRMMHGR